MAAVTNYLVIRSDPFELQAEQQRTFLFEAPSELVTDLSSARPILAFQVKRLAPSADGKTTLVIAINEHVLSCWRAEQAVQEQQQGVWETFQGRFLRPGVTNSVQFRMINGAARLAEVVLWFQRYG